MCVLLLSLSIDHEEVEWFGMLWDNLQSRHLYFNSCWRHDHSFWGELIISEMNNFIFSVCKVFQMAKNKIGFNSPFGKLQPFKE